MTQEEVEAIYRKEGYKLLSSYKNQRTKVKALCPKGHIYMSYPGNFMHRGNRCSTCDADNISRRQTTPYEDVVRECEKRGLTLLWSEEEYYEKYVGPKRAKKRAESKVPLQCVVGHRFKLTLCTLKSCKYGCDKCFKKVLASEKRKSVSDIRKYLKEEKKYTLLSDSYTNNKEKLHIRCGEGHEFMMSWNDVDNRHGCPTCSGRHSLKEQELLEWVRTMHPDAGPVTFKEIGVDDTQREIDVYVPSLRLGIEFNGLLWHSERYLSDSKAHTDKFKACREAGVHLITVFEHEWDYRRPQVEGFLLSKLGENATRLYARKCRVSQVNVAEARRFLDKHHIQGSCPAEVAVGLHQ